MLYGRERELQDRLSCIRRRVEEFPVDAFLGDCQVETSAVLTHLQEEKSEFTYYASVSSWILQVDRMNKEFFSCFRSDLLVARSVLSVISLIAYILSQMRFWRFNPLFMSHCLRQMPLLTR